MLLFDYLLAKYPTAKRQTLRQMVEFGRVTVGGQPARSLKTPVAESDVVRIDERPRPGRYSLAPLHLIREDKDILVVCKPPGLLTSTVHKERRPTAIAVIRRYLAQNEPRAQVGVIHRLDRDASGLLVFSKNHAVYLHLKRQFLEHSVQRIYTAVVHGKPNPPSGRIECHLVELPDGTVRQTFVPGKGELAVTEYKTLKTVGGVSLLRVTLHTGRKHQIRAHLAQRNNPIVGDSLYGDAKDDKSRLLLAATTLAISHPRSGERMTFEIPPPREIQAALEISGP